MADNLTTPIPAGVTVAFDDVGSIFHERVKVVFGADGSASDVAPGNGLPIAGAYTDLSGSASANSTDLIASTDVRLYRSVVLQLSGTFSATVQVQVSNDNTNWVYLPVVQSGGTTSPSFQSGLTVTGLYEAPLNAKYLRVRTTAYTSGTATATVVLSTQPTPSRTAFLTGASGVAVTSQTLSPADAQSNGTTPQAGAMLFNGTSWDRWRTFGTLGVPGVSPVPGTSGGWSKASLTNLSNTVTAVKASAGQLGGYMLYNPNASVAYVQVFDLATGSVTLGTTTPGYVIPVPAGSAANLEITCGVAHATAISVAATTTPTGSTAPGTGLVGFVLYK